MGQINYRPETKMFAGQNLETLYTLYMMSFPTQRQFRLAQIQSFPTEPVDLLRDSPFYFARLCPFDSSGDPSWQSPT